MRITYLFIYSIVIRLICLKSHIFYFLLLPYTHKLALLSLIELYKETPIHIETTDQTTFLFNVERLTLT